MDVNNWVSESDLNDILLHANQALNPQITFSPGDSEADMLRNVIRSMMDSVEVIKRQLIALGAVDE